MSDLIFSARLRSLRGTRSKAEFARFLGVPPPMYHRYELGQVPKSDNLKVIADRCCVTIDSLIGINPDEQIHPGMAAAARTPATLSVVSSPSAASASASSPPACRFPADCDLDARMSAIEIKLDALLGLLGAPLRRETRSRTSKAS